MNKIAMSACVIAAVLVFFYPIQVISFLIVIMFIKGIVNEKE